MKKHANFLLIEKSIHACVFFFNNVGVIWSKTNMLQTKDTVFFV